MSASHTSISSDKLSRLIGTTNAPTLIDVRIDEDFSADPRIIPDAIRRSHHDVQDWASRLTGRSVIVICNQGQKVAEGMAAWLRNSKIAAEVLEGGHLGWREAGLPSVPADKIPSRDVEGAELAAVPPEHVFNVEGVASKRSATGSRANLQGLRRATSSLHEELRRPRLQDRVPDVSEGLQKVRMEESKSQLARCLIAALATGIGGLVTLDAGFVAAEGAPKLTGAQIRAGFVGKQFTDEVHYRLVYEPDGTLRSFSMSVKKVGKWIVEKDELCLYLGEKDDGCFRVALSGGRIELTPMGLGGALDGILQPAYHGNGGN